MLIYGGKIWVGVTSHLKTIGDGLDWTQPKTLEVVLHISPYTISNYPHLSTIHSPSSAFRSSPGLNPISQSIQRTMNP